MNMEALEILKKILNAQNILYGKEIEIVEQKIGAVKKDDIELLIEETEKEKEIISKIDTLEENRLKVIEKIGYENLRILAENILDKKLKLELLKLREELIDKLNKLKELNDILKELINITNGVIDITIKELTGFKEVGYKNDKKKSKVSDGNLLNRKG
jgi:hypothetical protein